MRSGSSQGRISDATRLAVMLLLLALLLVACKGTLLPLPSLNSGRILRWVVRLGMVGAADVAYVTLLAAVLGSLLALVRRRWPRRLGGFWPLAWAAVLGSALYGAVSVAVFRHLEMQLSWPMLQFFGEWQEMATSARAVVSWHTWLALASVLVGLVAAYRAAAWCLGRWPLHGSRRRTILLAGLAIAYFGTAVWWSQTRWQDHSLWQARLARSPHLRLIESLVVAAPGIHAADFSPQSPEFDDFRPGPKPAETALPESSIHPAKNIVILVLESVSAEYLGLYGSPYANTPNLERLSHQALVFENVYAQCPSSTKAMMAMFCGVYPRTDWREQTGAGQMPVPSLADVARRQGYRTGFFHSGDWSWRGGEEFLREHGFDHVRDARHLPQEECSWGQYDSWLFDEMCQWIDREPGPFVVVGWTIQTHHPYPVEGAERDYGVDDPELNRYLNAIAESDALVGRIWEALCRRGLDESTLLAVVGDHGEAFGQHNQRLHIFGLYEENVHVPLVIVHNDPALPVGRKEMVGQQIDLPATLAACAGIAAAPQWQGRNLLASERPARAYFYTVWDPVLFGVREGRYKYILEPGRRDALYDLAVDPQELDNVAADHPELRARLKRRLHALVAYEHPWCKPQSGRPAAQAGFSW